MDTHVTGEPPPPSARAMLAEDQHMARRMVRTRGVASADADDVTQEVMIALEARRAGFQVPEGRTRAEAWRAFVWGVVVRQVARYRSARARQRREEQAVAEEAEAIAPSMEDVMIAEAPRVLLRRAVQALAPHLRAVMVLHLAGLLMPAAAAKLEIPYGTVWTRFRYACDAVRATVGRWAAEEARQQRAATRACGRCADDELTPARRW